MSGPTTMGMQALGGNPYITKLKSGSGSGLTLQPVQQYQGKSGTVQNPETQAPTLGTGIANAVSNAPNQLQQMQKLMQWRQQMNGGNGGLFSQNESNYVPPMNSDQGGVWAGNPSESQVGPETPTPDASTGVNMNTVEATPSASADAANTAGLGGGAGAGGMGSMGGIGSAIGSSIAAPIEQSGQQAQKIASSLKPDINVPQVQYPVPQLGGGLVV